MLTLNHFRLTAFAQVNFQRVVYYIKVGHTYSLGEIRRRIGVVMFGTLTCQFKPGKTKRIYHSQAT